jgi:predicted nucleic acid-binding Zn ribbon protein
MPFGTDSAARKHVCEHCAAVFKATRSDQRFCSDLCRLRHWRSRRALQSMSEAIDAGRLAALVAEVDRLGLQVAELQQANATLREALSQTQLQLFLARNRHQKWRCASRSSRVHGRSTH